MKSEKINSTGTKSETKEVLKNAGKEAGLAILQGITFSLKTIRQGLKWASEDEVKAKPAQKKSKKRSGAQVIIIR